ncbi:MAG: ArsR family transcriptional regulator [Flavobacteriaceae bacterium]|jgi:Lrp/AsnC family leucine-responsive transcriptional regulator|nr:ArsR family transcriptional regulator [Flavobacteriaceae bacterium]|tara:strand:+ start:7280 stop:7726 length:447 start_codon:yes stop_codon:yes gene_type:complete
MKLDNIHAKILNALQSNARISNTQIAASVGISSAAVAERIKKMEDCSVISGYHAKVNPRMLGHGLRALITVRAFMGRLQPFLHKIKTYDEVVNCYRITGNENIVMEVFFKDQLHLELFIDELISYGETKTQIILSDVISHQPIKHRQF